MKPAPSPCSALFSAVTAEYSAHEDEHTLQLSRFRAFVLAVTEAREQLASSSSPVRGPGSTGVLVSARVMANRRIRSPWWWCSRRATRSAKSLDEHWEQSLAPRMQTSSTRA